MSLRGGLVDALQHPSMFAERRLVLLVVPETQRSGTAALLEEVEAWAAGRGLSRACWW